MSALDLKLYEKFKDLYLSNRLKGLHGNFQLFLAIFIRKVKILFVTICESIIRYCNTKCIFFARYPNV